MSNSVMTRISVTLALACLLALNRASAAVTGCASASVPYSPYTLWNDLPANRDGLVDYVPITHFKDYDSRYADPRVVLESTAATDITVILMHGKNGTPLGDNFTALANELSALGYKVIMPSMSWGRNLFYTLNQAGTAWEQHAYYAWEADRCQTLNHIQSLVAAERAQGRRVLLMGHSMGAQHALLYGHLNTENDIIGIIASAPGGLVPLASSFMQATAAERQRAKSAVQAGNGDVIDEYETLNTDGMEQILTTAKIYLTYHEPDPDAIPDDTYTPDIRNVLANINEPVLWLVGKNDSLKTFYENQNIYQMLPNNPSNQYRVLNGDHRSVLFNESGPIDSWFNTWSAINPADRDSDGVADVDDNYPDTGGWSEHTPE